MNIYRFESYVLDADRGELRRGFDLIQLEPQVFDLLSYLVRNRDRIVSKDDLIAGVWAGRIVTESTLSSRITAVRQAVGDSGKQQRLVRTVRRKGYRFVGTVRHAKVQFSAEIPGAGPSIASDGFALTALREAMPRLRHKPSVAVLPFANLSADPALGYLIDGVVEDITTGLSRFRWLYVIARSSSFAYQGESMDIRQVGRELGVRYVLEGNARKAAEGTRITARLIDTANGAYLWANNWDWQVGETFDLQDRVTASIVWAVGSKLEQAESERVKSQPIDSLGADELYLRGMANVYRWSEAGMGDALRLFHQAIENDPGFAPAYGMAAYCYVQRKSYGWFTDPSQEIAACARLGQRAAELGMDDAVTLSRAAHALAYVVGDVENGVALIEKACQLSPNLSLGWYVSGWVRVFLGEPELAIEHLTTALRLSPFDRLAFKMHAAVAYANFFAARYDEASVSAEHALCARPNYLTAERGAAASHAFAGRLSQARRLITHVRERDSALRISNLKDLIPLRRAGDLDRLAEGLDKAGLPA
jgi:TolB-like protein/DNA-binding winged helix-turn-helix (wHTH) protein